MEENFLEYSLKTSLVCPLCKGSLKIRKAIKHNDIIQRAFLNCTLCGTLFKIYARIPVLLKPGLRADWNHPIVEALFGYTTESYENLLEKYGVAEVRRRFFELLRGKYSPSKVFFKEPVDKSLLAKGAWRVRKSSIEKHLKKIREWSKDLESFREMIKIVKNFSPNKLLDMCSGGGFFLTRLIEKYRDFKEFYSFDIDYICAKRVEGTLMYYNLLDKSLPLVTDARLMPFKQNYFDVITNNCGFNQILGLTSAVREAYRVLKPEGKLVIRENYGITRWNNSKTRRDIGFSIDELIKLHKYCDIYIDKESFIKILEKYGFTIALIKDFTNKFLVICIK